MISEFARSLAGIKASTLTKEPRPPGSEGMSKMRSLTDNELAEVKEQRDRSLDALEGIAVTEETGND